MTARSVFVSADGEGRVRAGWRILIFLIIAALVAQAIGFAVKPIHKAIDRIAGVQDTAAILVATLGVLLAHFVMLRWVDKRPWSYVWLDRAAARPRVLGRGWLLGALPILVPSILLLGAGWLAVRAAPDGPWWIAAVQVTVFVMLAAAPEELLSRGYLFAALRDGLGGESRTGWVAALLVTSFGFGVLHMYNPGADVRSIAIVTLSGIFLGMVVIVTRSLYAAWMAHWAWNWVMAVPLHTLVSGQPLPHPDYQIVDAGPDWMTGGAWGPEGGTGAAVGILAGLAYLYMRRPPLWRTSGTRKDTEVEASSA